MKPAMLAAATAATWALAASLVLAAPAGTNPYRLGNSRVTHSCDVELNVIDPDPRGLNVRSGPSAKTGKVIAKLMPEGEWTYVHVVGQAGAWLLIDRATVVDDDAPDFEREVFRGGGWVHSSTLGFSELVTGEGTQLREAPDPAAKVLRTATPDDDGGRIRVLGCRGRFIQVQLDGIAPWTDTWCNNERTTCS